MADNFPNLGKDSHIQIYKANRSLRNEKPKGTFPRHIMTKLSETKDEEGILKAEREQKLSHTREPPYGSLWVSQRPCRPGVNGVT